MNDTTKNIWVNKIVQIYPSDTYSKFGEIIAMSSEGVTFKCVDAHSQSGWKVGEIRFISYSAKLSFKKV